MRRGSSKPCPGCGKVDEWRQGDSVCKECKTRLARVEYLETELKRLTAEKMVVRMGNFPHLNEYINVRSGTGLDYATKLRKAFFDLALAVTTTSATSEGFRGVTPELLGEVSGGILRLISPDIFTAVRNLHKLMQPLIEAAYQQGKHDGSRLLTRLAAGEITLNEFEERTQ